MIGYIAPNNDVFCFFENNEIKELSIGNISEIFVNFENPKFIGKLEVEILDNFRDLIKTEIKKDENKNVIYMKVLMLNRAYERFKERGLYAFHEEYRHINLLDSNNLDFSNQNNYLQVKHFPQKD